MKVAIVCDWFFWLDGSRFGTGGVETYLQNLIHLLRGGGCEVAIFQRGTRRFSAAWESCPVQSWRSFEEQTYLLQAFHGGKSGPTIYSDFHVIGPTVSRPSVVIQHGVYWDVPYRRFQAPALQWLLNWKKSLTPLLHSRRLLRQIRKVDRVITVDTNFQNWMRTMCGWADLEAKWVYVPNFADPYPEPQVHGKLRGVGPIRRILFARRFEAFRGIWLWANVVKRLGPLFPDIEFCFCGHGQMKGTEVRLGQELASLPNAKVYERPYDEMREQHYAADIEVVPSCGSEGTSFSLIEAMAGGACVVATNVGGLPNLVIHEYNGLLVQPTEEQIESVVVSLIHEPARARGMARNGYQTVLWTFSRQNWERRISAVMEETLGLPRLAGR